MKAYKYACLLALALCYSGGLGAQILSGDSWSNIEKNKEGTIVISYLETPNFVYKNAEGRLDGICIDILREFVSYLQKSRNVKIKVSLQKKTEDFSIFLNTIKNAKGGVFGLGPITITGERKKAIAFTPPYIDNLSVLISNSKAPDLESLANIAETFKGMKAYALRNSTQEAELLDIKRRHFPELNIEYVSNPNELISKTLEDPKSFTRIDFLFYVDASQDKKPIKRHAVADIKTSPLGIILPLESDWLPLWEEFLTGKAAFKSKPEYQKILVKHLGTSAARALTNIN